jgi:hypothetical protein
VEALFFRVVNATRDSQGHKGTEFLSYFAGNLERRLLGRERSLPVTNFKTRTPAVLETIWIPDPQKSAGSGFQKSNI